MYSIYFSFISIRLFKDDTILQIDVLGTAGQCGGGGGWLIPMLGGGSRFHLMLHKVIVSNIMASLAVVGDGVGLWAG